MSDHALWSYPKVYNLGSAEVDHLFDDPVVVQEKVDGSQFSFARFDDRLVMRSKGATVWDREFGGFQPGAGTMFQAAIEWVLNRADLLVSGHVYRCEFLSKPKHNTLAYDRVPLSHLILFDVEYAQGVFADRRGIEVSAAVLGLEPVADLTMPDADRWTPDVIRGTLERTSQLGGQRIEGLVFKNYLRPTPWAPVTFGKHVSEAFRETHRGDWKKRNPSNGDVIEQLVHALRTPARWEKAVQHLRDAGQLEGSPRDIGPLIRELQGDALEEEAAFVRDQLYKWAAPRIQRALAAGFAEWYKQRLLEQQFAESDRETS